LKWALIQTKVIRREEVGGQNTRGVSGQQTGPLRGQKETGIILVLGVRLGVQICQRAAVRTGVVFAVSMYSMLESF